MRTCTKIFFKKFMFLILTFLLYCNYTFTAQSTPDVHFYNVQEGENICINSTNFPFYLILNQISFQNLIYFYRIMAAGETASLDYVSTSSSMPYATRAESVGSSFSIHALSSGPCIISTFTTTQCKDGIELTTAATRTIDFNTTTDNYFYNITSGSTKCIFISENQSFSISGELQMHGLYDKVCVITSTGSNCYQQSETFQTEVTSQYYAFITIDMNNTIQTDRSFSLTTESNSKGKSIIYGQDSLDPIQPEPEPIEIIHKVQDVSTWAWVLLLIVLVIFFGLLIFATIRYEWFRCLFDRCCKSSRKEKFIQDPRMPSEFIKTPQ